MTLLLDTNALLWWLGDVELKADARQAIADPGLDVYVSPVSLWEINIKVMASKLHIEVPLAPRVRAEFRTLPVSLEHGDAAGALPLHHRDPFDRMLIAQAMIERLTVVTRDRRFADYDVAVLNC